MQCTKCKTENREGARFCRGCGAALTLMCPECGTELLPDTRFCDSCGTELGAPEPAASDVVVDRLQRLVPKEYAERLLATRGQVPAERRLVTILFSDIKGSTAMAEDLDPEEVMEIMDGAFDVLIEPVYRYEGTLARLMGDAVLAFFGAPIAHEDDPERAVRAALDIIEGASQYAARLERERGITAFNVRVGINTGLVVVGEVGSDLRVEYTAMGDAINLAARMEQNAPPGGILITHDTYRHVRGVFDVLRQEPLTVKGRRQPVQTYLVQRAKPRAFRKGTRGVEGIETRMVGRQAELNRLQEAFYTAMEDRELQMATIVGEAGVGKSRLLHELDLWAELLPQTYFFFKGRALQEMQSLPYSLMRNLFAFRFQIEDSDPLSAVQAKWEQGVQAAMGEGEDRPMRAHFIAHLLGFELGRSPHLESVLDDPKQMRERALTCLADYFKALTAQAPVLILLEDLHWADDSSLDLLNELALALTDEPVMIVSAARPALFERRPHWGEGQAFHSQLPLRPLTKRNTRRLLGEILQRADQVPDTLSELVVAGAEGNPFFVEELVKMLVEDGVIVTGQDQWRVEPSRLTEVHVPPTLRGVLQARLDRLPPEERTVLQQAAVVGRLFWDRAVVSINESTEEDAQEAEVLESLSALRGREMVFQRETTSIADAQEYIFQHAMLREVTYESLLKRLRRIYHGLVADWLIEQTGERAGEYTGLIADHLELAGRTEEATEYLLQAGDRARRLYAHREAIGAYQRALALLKEQGDHERGARTWMKLGLTYHTAFDFQRSREAYDKGFLLWQRAGREPPAVGPAADQTLRVAVVEPTTLDPSTCTDLDSIKIVGQLFSALVQLTPEQDVAPDAARSWKIAAGGRTYIFHLREGMQWSDGHPVTAGDFLSGFRRAVAHAKKTGANVQWSDIQGVRAYLQNQLSDLAEVGVRALDDVTLVIDLEEPTSYILQLLSWFYAVPRHVVNAYGESWSEPATIVTNGPFRVQARQHGTLLVLERNANYHGPFFGNVQRIEAHILRGEATSHLDAYEHGDLDIANIEEAPTELERVRQQHAGEYVSAPELWALWMGFDLTRPPFHDPRVRRAFALALDRETMARQTGGYAAPEMGGVVPPGMPGHSPTIALPYRPQAARDLLAQCGYSAGAGMRFPRVELWYPTRPAVAAPVECLIGQWQQVLGLDVCAEAVEWVPYIARLLKGLPHVWAMCWAADYPDPDNFLRAGMSEFRRGWPRQPYEELLETARHISDQSERMRLYQQADRMVVEDALVLPLTYRDAHYLIKPWVKSYPLSSLAPPFWKDVIIEPH